MCARAEGNSVLAENTNENRPTDTAANLCPFDMDSPKNDLRGYMLCL